MNNIMKVGEDALGKLMFIDKWMLPEDTKQGARVEMNASPFEDIKAFGEIGRKNTWKDAIGKLTTGLLPGDVKFNPDAPNREYHIKYKWKGKEKQFNPFVAGRLHGFEKTIFGYKISQKRVIASLAKEAVEHPENLDEHGNIKDDVMEEIYRLAHIEGYRTALLQPNAVASWIRGGQRAAERSNNRAVKVLGKLFEFQTQVLTVGLNYLDKSTTYIPAYGHLKAYAPILSRKFGWEMEKMTPEEHDFVVRNLKSANIGLALFGFGIAAQGMFDDDGNVVINGKKMPKALTHIPILYVMYAGHLFGKWMAGKHEDKSTMRLAVENLNEMNPFSYTEREFVEAMTSDKKFYQFLHNQTLGRLTPQFMKEISKHDVDGHGKPIKRDIKSEWDRIKVDWGMKNTIKRK
jgi:hypothetical protein